MSLRQRRAAVRRMSVVALIAGLAGVAAPAANAGWHLDPPSMWSKTADGYDVQTFTGSLGALSGIFIHLTCPTDHTLRRAVRVDTSGWVRKLFAPEKHVSTVTLVNADVLSGHRFRVDAYCR